MKGWDGDPTFWRAESGALVGQTTRSNPLKQNTFVIWRGGEPADFELKVEFRINAPTAASSIRSVQLPGPDRPTIRQLGAQGLPGRHRLRQPVHRQIYEERGRGFLAMRGTGRLHPRRRQRGSVGELESGDELKAFIKVNDWNQVHVIARGNTLIDILNGHVTAVFVDDDVKARALKGLLGFQIHVGPPMKVEFRNVYLKTVSQ